MRITPKKIRKRSKLISKAAKEAAIEHLEEVIADGDADYVMRTYDGKSYTAAELLIAVKKDTIAGRTFVKEGIVAWAKQAVK